MSSSTVQSTHGSYLMPSLEHATVADAMHPGVLSCDADATATEVARMMVTHHVHCIVAMDAGESAVWGLISDRDLLRAGINGDPDCTARSLATKPMITVDPAMPLREVAEMMVSEDASHVVVFDSRLQRPVGILSTLDIAGTLAWGEA